MILVCALYEGERVTLFQGLGEYMEGWSEVDEMSVVGFFR